MKKEMLLLNISLVNNKYKGVKTMKPLELAKKIWDYAKTIGVPEGKDPRHTSSPLHHYPGILSMFAGIQAAAASDDKEWIDEVNSYLAKYPHRFNDPDVFFSCAFDNYRVGSLGKGWAVMKGLFDEDKELIREYAELTLAAPRSDDGIICHPTIPDKRIWVDVVFAVTPFMLYAGIILNEEKYIDYAVEQCFKMYDVFMDKSNGLLHQTRGFLEDKSKTSDDHWSRGNGWGILGMTELVRYLPKDSKYYAEAVERFKAHCEALIKYQNFRGLWRQEIPESLSWEESSGTGIFLYAFGVGMRRGILDRETYMPVLEKGIEGICKYCINTDLSIEKCCCGCCCPGVGDMKGTVEAYLTIPMPKRNDSHVFGPVIMALTEAENNGIKNVEF